MTGTRGSGLAGREGMTEAIPLLVVGLRDKNARGIETAGEAPSPGWGQQRRRHHRTVG